MSHPELPAVALGDRVVASYAELGRRVSGLATGLRDDLGLATGDRVAIATANHPCYIETLFGVWWAGLVAVPVNSRLHPSEIDWILRHSSARAVFTSDLVATGLGSLELELRHDPIVFGSAQQRALSSREPSDLIARGPGDLAWLFYTSGTTGRPKGAMISHRNLVAMSLGYLVEVSPTLPGDVLLHAAPMSHGSGLYCVPHVARAGLNVVPESGGFDPSEIFELIARYPATSLFAAPTMIKRMVDCPDDLVTESIRTIVWGGAPMHVSDILAALERFGPCLAQIYGQGESPMTISVLSKDDVAARERPRWLERLASAGIPSSVVDVVVANDEPPNDEIHPGPTAEVGEVLVRGDTVVSGYWNDPEGSSTRLAGGWLHTGDVGRFDEDGYLTLLDRANDLIISGGSNIYPREVEEILTMHTGVREASVIGRADPEWGEIVVAYIVADRMIASELDRLCLERIARFKRPRDYVFVDELPKNSYGKILKTEIRELDHRRGELGLEAS